MTISAYAAISTEHTHSNDTQGKHVILASILTGPNRNTKHTRRTAQPNPPQRLR